MPVISRLRAFVGALGAKQHPALEAPREVFAAVCAAIAERFEPDSATSGVYDRIFSEVYTPLYPALRDPLDRLARIRADGDAS